MTKIKVLIVDDSQVMQKLLTQILTSDPELEIVACAEDPYQARDLIKLHNPDVLTLDIEMPKMDGITFLKNLMRLRPMPVVMCSTLSKEGANVTLQALEIGAVDFIPKPQVTDSTISEFTEAIIGKVKQAASSNIKSQSSSATSDSNSDVQLCQNASQASEIGIDAWQRSGLCIAIGASTGGVEAIREVITAFPEQMPPIFIVQHMPKVFTPSYAKRLNEASALTVHEVTDGQEVLAGNVYIAPGDEHMVIKKVAGKYCCRLTQTEKVSGHRPSVDVLFSSLAELAPEKCVAALLTGMGADGAEGLKQLNNANAYTIAQDEASSVVWGMPRVAVEMQAASTILPLNKVADELIKALQKKL